MELNWWPMVAPPLPCRNDLEFDTDADGWANEPCVRVGGDAECPTCGLPYWRHPRVTDEVPTLRRACDGRMLKL